MSPRDRTEERVLAQVDALADEMVEFLRALTRVPTVNPPGEGYRECAELIGARLREFGYDVEFITAEGHRDHSSQHPRVNVMGARPGVRRPTLHFNGHFDVVPAGAGWTVDPWGGEVRDGKVYGRGTSDQKAGIAASLYAVEAIRRAGLTLAGTVEQSGTVDEESGGFAGVAYLVERGYLHRHRTDYVIITEPLEYDRICLGHRGVYWFKVATQGRIAHGSMPFLGVNAIEKMGAFLHEVEHRLKPAIAARLTAMPVEPPEARRATLNINSIAGGQSDGGWQTPCVADHCEAVFDRRFLLEERFADVRGEVEALLAERAAADPDFQFTLEDLLTVLPVQTAADCELVREVSAAIESVVGRTPPLIASPGTYDQKHVMRMGLVEQCIAYGPGLLRLAHQPDEYCRIDHLVASAKVMALSTLRLLGTTTAA
jgi:succinyl-diaminopimelate desuccinylase